jgi:hypothetical protein
MSKTWALTIFILLTVGAASAYAGSIFLNGINITELRDKTFTNATVYIDSKGDVHINAPKYKVKVMEETAPVAPVIRSKDRGGPNPDLAGHYYLVTTPSPGGKAQFDFVLTINGVERKVIKAGSPQVIMEISVWLRRGSNNVNVTARKQVGATRKSFSPSDRASVILGKGHEAGKKVKIDAVYISLAVNASQTQSTSERYSIDAK